MRSGTAALRLGAVAVMGPGAFFLLTSGPAVLPRVVFAHVGAGRVVCVFVRDGCFFSDEVVECHCLEPGCGRHGAVHKATGRIAAALRWWRQALI